MKQKVGKLYRKRIVEGDINLVDPNSEIHVSELGGSTNEEDVEYLDLSNDPGYNIDGVGTFYLASGEALQLLAEEIALKSSDGGAQNYFKYQGSPSKYDYINNFHKDAFRKIYAKIRWNTEIYNQKYLYSKLKKSTLRDQILEGGTEMINYINSVPRITKEQFYSLVDNTQPEVDPNCVILYTTTDGSLFYDYEYPDNNFVEGANLISNTYKNGQGMLVYDAPVENIKASAFSELNTSGSNGVLDRPVNTILLPASIKSFGEYPFYASKLHALYCKALVRPTIGENDYLFEQGSVTVIYVPAEAVGTYQNTPKWKSSNLSAYYLE
jgi:hypothetical protein